MKSNYYWKALTSNAFSFCSTLMVVLILIMVVFGPWIALHDPIKSNLKEPFQGFSWNHPFGTDGLGRDLFSRILVGARKSFFGALTAIAIGIAVGLPIGLISGYFSEGKLDYLVMVITEALMGFQYFLLVLLFVVLLGRSLISNMIAIGLWVSPYYARLIRSSVLSIKDREFVEAARMTGEKELSLITIHILPNCISIVLIWSTIYFARAMLMSAGLSFLGFGAQPPAPEWGAMVAVGRDYMFFHPPSLIVPSIFILLTALSFNFIGDTLRDALDPELRGGLIS